MSAASGSKSKGGGKKSKKGKKDASKMVATAKLPDEKEQQSSGVSLNDNQESRQRGIEAEAVNDFIVAMTSGGKAQLLADHDSLRKKERHVFYFMRNPTKNRFANVVLFNEGAVILDKQNKDDCNYIHATKLRSKYGQFILAQAPKQDTLLEWYRMIWQYNVRVIVCLVPMTDKEECSKYFELKQGKKAKHKKFTMKTFAVRPEKHSTTYEMRFSNSGAKSDDRERTVHIAHFPDWSLTVAPPTRQLLQLMKSVWALEQSVNSSDAKEAPVLVHGCSGVRRTGTYVIMSLLCKQLRERGAISVTAACTTVRKYRYGVMRNRTMFGSMVDAVLNFAADQGMVDRQSANFKKAIKCIKATFPNKKDKKDDEDDEGGDE